MTDEEAIDAVTAKLTGKFYVGQRVKTGVGITGTIESFGNFGQGEHARLIDTNTGDSRTIFLWALQPYDHP